MKRFFTSKHTSRIASLLVAVSATWLTESNLRHLLRLYEYSDRFISNKKSDFGNPDFFDVHLLQRLVDATRPSKPAAGSAQAISRDRLARYHDQLLGVTIDICDTAMVSAPICLY